MLRLSHTLHWFFPLVILAFTSTDILAQGDSWPPGSGTRVRITFKCGPESRAAQPGDECRLVGGYLGRSGDSLRLQDADSSYSRSVTSLQQLEVSRGRKSRWLLGAGIGFIVGAGATYAITRSGGSGSPCDSSSNQDAISSKECLALTLGGGLVGAGIGAAIGSLSHTERWQVIPLERLRLGLLIEDRGMKLTLGRSFAAPPIR